MRGTWDFREGMDLETPLDGYEVDALDGKVGKVDDAMRAAPSYVVVDSGFWIFGKKRLIPAGVVDRVDHQQQKVHLSVTKQELKGAPQVAHEGDTTRLEHYFEPFVRN